MAVTEEGGRAFPEPTIGERAILGVSETAQVKDHYSAKVQIPCVCVMGTSSKKCKHRTLDEQILHDKEGDSKTTATYRNRTRTGTVGTISKNQCLDLPEPFSGIETGTG